jgi:hypothetical protein
MDGLVGRVCLPNDEVSNCAYILFFKRDLNATDIGATTETTEGEISQSL